LEGGPVETKKRDGTAFCRRLPSAVRFIIDAVIVEQPNLKRSAVGFWKADSKTEIVAGETRHIALVWVIRLRYGFIAGEIAILAALRFGLQIDFPLLIIGPAIAIQVASNWLLASNKQRLGGGAEHLVGALFAVDALCLTLILALSGGPANPFSLFYLVQITFSAMVLHRLWTWALGVISTVSFGLLFLISRDVPAFHEHSQSGEFSLHLFGMWIAFAAAALLISFFVGKLSTESRHKESELRLMEKRLAKNDRLASLVTLSAGAAHEIATPLATIAVTAKEMEREARANLRNMSLEEDAQLIRAQVERCRVILERMGAQGADPFGEAPRPVDLRDLLNEIQQKFQSEQVRIQVVVRNTDVPRCVLPVRATVEALSALVKNALDASTNGKPVLLEAAESTNERVRFVVRDEGIGMTPEVLERVAEPFFTTKAPGQGMGLGAFLAYLFAQTLGGQLSFESELGCGCSAILELPNMKNVSS
jgi:two-component system sensor histidine kinase RegB